MKIENCGESKIIHMPYMVYAEWKSLKKKDYQHIHLNFVVKTKIFCERKWNNNQLFSMVLFSQFILQILISSDNYIYFVLDVLYCVLKKLRNSNSVKKNYLNFDRNWDVELGHIEKFAKIF